MKLARAVLRRSGHQFGGRYCMVANIGNQRNAIVSNTTADSPYLRGPQRSNAEKLINEVKVIEVDGHLAVCDGGAGGLGHPIEYIQLDTVSTEPAVCKYCGLRFKMSHGSHH